MATPPQLPCIDFSGVDPSAPSAGTWPEVRAQVMDALAAFGCFEARYPALTPALRSALFDGAVRPLFGLPAETKRRNYHGPDRPFDGYVGGIPGYEGYESLAIVDGAEPEQVRDFADLMWPDGGCPAGFCEAVHGAARSIVELEAAVRKMVMEGLGVVKYHEPLSASTWHLFRMSKYKAPHAAERTVRYMTHQDTNLLSFVCQHEVEGLEVRTKAGEWILARPSPASLVVLAGNSLREISLSGGRFQSCLREIRKRACAFEDGKKGIKIKKEDWEKLHVHIASYNNFPTAAGLASSAAGFACLVFTLGKLMNVKEDYGQLSSIARQGSGSACRSLYGGFVKWCMGKKDDGSDSMAVQLVDEAHWNDLVIIIAVVSSKQKETSSTSGMRDSVETSPLLQYRAQTVVPSRILKMEGAIKNRDFASFAKLTCADSNQFHAVCLDTSPPIFYMNDTSHRIISLVEKWNHSEGTPQVAYTFDAGPNAVLIAPNRKTATLLLKKLLYYFPPQEKDLSSYLVGDKSILSDAGLHSIEDVDALPVPPEMKIPDQKFKGDVSYFICSRLGTGPKVVTDEIEALIDSVTGLPKGI